MLDPSWATNHSVSPEVGFAREPRSQMMRLSAAVTLAGVGYDGLA